MIKEERRQTAAAFADSRKGGSIRKMKRDILKQVSNYSAVPTVLPYKNPERKLSGVFSLLHGGKEHACFFAPRKKKEKS